MSPEALERSIARIKALISREDWSSVAEEVRMAYRLGYEQGVSDGRLISSLGTNADTA